MEGVLVMYISTLRQKQGELRALDMLEARHVNSNLFIPNIILKDSSIESLQQIKDKFNSKVILDTRDLDADEIGELEENVLLADFQHFYINYSIENCITNWPTEKFDYVKIPKNLLNEFFVQWVQANNLKFPKNIMFDFEAVKEILPDETLSIVTKIIDTLGEKNYIICSGAIPNSVPENASTDYKLQRFELDVFSQIKEKIGANIIFSDYSTVSPVLSSGGRAIVQIKYTLENEYWFVRNGLRRGNYNFVSVCDTIVSKASTFDAQSCWADKYIQDVHISGENSGNPSVWASLGINKHLVMCINENL